MHQLFRISFNPHDSIFDVGIVLSISQNQKLSLGEASGFPETASLVNDRAGLHTQAELAT